MPSKQKDAYIKKALSFVGYLEKNTNAQLDDFTANAGSGNYTLFGKWYDEHFKTGGFNGAAWCHAFVTYNAFAVGISDSVIPYTASCGTGVNWFKQRGQWHARLGYTPVTGDIIYFSRDGKTPAHVGIVTDADASFVHTVEGNTSGGSTLVSNGGGVAKKKYPLSYASILGYGHPAYAEDKDETAEFKAVILQHVKLDPPEYWWKIIETSPYASALYKKWAESYK